MLYPDKQFIPSQRRQYQNSAIQTIFPILGKKCRCPYSCLLHNQSIIQAAHQLNLIGNKHPTFTRYILLMKKTLTIVLTVILILLAGVIAAHAQSASAAGKTVSLTLQFLTGMSGTSATGTCFTTDEVTEVQSTLKDAYQSPVLKKHKKVYCLYQTVMGKGIFSTLKG